MADELTFPPLALSSDEWRSRWLVNGQWDVLHRISTIEWEDGEKISGTGRTVCGLEDSFVMPGIFSRMGLKRCDACCEALHIPGGEGAPFNEKDVDWQHA